MQPIKSRKRSADPEYLGPDLAVQTVPHHTDDGKFECEMTSSSHTPPSCLTPHTRAIITSHTTPHPPNTPHTRHHPASPQHPTTPSSLRITHDSLTPADSAAHAATSSDQVDVVEVEVMPKKKQAKPRQSRGPTWTSIEISILVAAGIHASHDPATGNDNTKR